MSIKARDCLYLGCGLVFHRRSVRFHASAPTHTNIADDVPPPTTISLDDCSIIGESIFWSSKTLTIMGPLSRNDASISSKVLPRVSGMNKPQIAAVSNDEPPNRKYTPYEERARNIGVVNATIQFTIYQTRQHCLRHDGRRHTQLADWPKLAAPALVFDGWISET
jgi:hypothetical protein